MARANVSADAPTSHAGVQTEALDPPTTSSAGSGPTGNSPADDGPGATGGAVFRATAHVQSQTDPAPSPPSDLIHV